MYIYIVCVSVWQVLQLLYGVAAIIGIVGVGLELKHVVETNSIRANQRCISR